MQNNIGIIVGVGVAVIATTGYYFLSKQNNVSSPETYQEYTGNEMMNIKPFVTGGKKSRRNKRKKTKRNQTFF
jgi:hypothetical protein